MGIFEAAITKTDIFFLIKLRVRKLNEIEKDINGNLYENLANRLLDIKKLKVGSHVIREQI